MSPVNTSASSSDVDNEATAELPVLDVAAYESTLGERTDSWAVPHGASITITGNAIDATTEMPGLLAESIPTLQTIAEPYDLDHSGTHEMPAMPQQAKQKAHSRSHRQSAPPAKPAIVAPRCRKRLRPKRPRPTVQRRLSPRRSPCRRHRRSSKSGGMRWPELSDASKSSSSAHALPTPSET